MNRFPASIAILSAALLLGFSALALADKEKPKDAATFDDSSAMLTENEGGKEKKTTIDLKYSLKVKGYFDKDGFNMEEVGADGPASKLIDGAGEVVLLEKGDIITEVDGKKVKSAQDYAKAMNGVADPAKIKLKVRDVNTGKEIEFHANADKR